MAKFVSSALDLAPDRSGLLRLARASADASMEPEDMDTQKTIVTNDGVGPLVSLLKMGSAKVQEVAASALAAIDSDISYQQGIIKAGAILPLVSMLKGGSAAAQAFAAQATANAAAFSTEAQRSIAKAGSIPLLLSLLGTGKAQKPGACISGCGLRACPCACLVGLLT